MGPGRTILHNANLATFLVSVFGGKDVGFYDLNDNFLNIFAPDGQALTREQGKIFIDLKTQMLVAAATSESQDMSNIETIETLFPHNFESELSLRHPGKSLASSEIDFLKSARERRQYLTGMCSDIDSIRKYCPKRAEWFTDVPQRRFRKSLHGNGFCSAYQNTSVKCTDQSVHHTSRPIPFLHPNSLEESDGTMPSSL